MFRMVSVLIGLVAVTLAIAVAPAAAATGVPANIKLCKGFEVVYGDGTLPVFVRSDGSAFASYADCVTYAAKGGTLIRWSQFVCESFGGTYVSGNFTESGALVWTCRNFTFTGSGSAVDFNNFGGPCTADVLAAGAIGGAVEWVVIDLVGSGNVIECRGFF